MKEYLAAIATILETAFRTSAVAIFIAILAGVVRTIISEDKRTLGGYCRGLLMAIFVAFMVSNLLDSYNASQGLKTFVIAVCAFSADDLLFALLKISRALRDDPLRFIRVILRLTGRE